MHARTHRNWFIRRKSNCRTQSMPHNRFRSFVVLKTKKKTILQLFQVRVSGRVVLFCFALVFRWCCSRFCCDSRVVVALNQNSMQRILRSDTSFARCAWGRREKSSHTHTRATKRVFFRFTFWMSGLRTQYWLKSFVSTQTREKNTLKYLNRQKCEIKETENCDCFHCVSTTNPIRWYQMVPIS